MCVCVGLYIVTSTVKHIYNIYSCLRVVQCSVYTSRGLLSRHWSGLAPLQPTTEQNAQCFCAMRTQSDGSSVDVARSLAGWLLASAQCVARRAPAGRRLAGSS
jgi:hypothetical protein